MSKSLDEWAGLALTGMLTNKCLDLVAVTGSKKGLELASKTAFDIAEAMQKESQERNQSYINRTHKGLTE